MTLASDVTGMDVLIGSAIGQGAPEAQSFSKYIGFGDATDTGYFFTHPISNNPTVEAQYKAAVAAGGGLPTSLGGVMNPTLLAADFGLTAIPVGETGGTNYAASGATVTGVLNANSLAPSIVSQIQTYLASVSNHADPNALYQINGGAGDVEVAETMTGTAAQDAYMVQQANTFAQAIEQLYAAGARNLLLSGASESTTLGQIFNETVQSDLAAAGISFIAAQNTQNVVQPIEANPAAFGITNITEPPEGPFTASNPYNPNNGGADINPIPSMFSGGWALYATQLVSPNAGNTYLYADNLHLSAAAQRIVANSEYNLIQNDVPTVNETLTATVSVTGNTSGQDAYQWQSLAPGQTTWVNIAGATSSTFVVQQADLGLQLRVQATYTDSAGTSTEVSAPSAAVVAAKFPFVNNSDIVEAVYIGYFGRAGEPAGDTFWLNNLNSGAINANQMAASYSVQTEATSLYPFLANPSTATAAQVSSFIESVYQGLFNRAADSAGLTFWQGYLTTNLGNPQAVGAFILAVLDGAQGSDVATIENKVAAAEYFTKEFAAASAAFGTSADALAHSVIAAVTSDSSTILPAETTINNFLLPPSSAAEVALVGTSHASLVSSMS